MSSIKTLETAAGPSSADDVAPKPTVTMHKDLTVFVSTRFADSWLYGHGLDMIDSLEKAIEAEGFKPVFCLPHRDPARLANPLKNHLYARIEEANSLLQIIPLLDDEKASPASRRLASARPALAPKCNRYLFPGPYLGKAICTQAIGF